MWGCLVENIVHHVHLHVYQQRHLLSWGSNHQPLDNQLDALTTPPWSAHWKYIWIQTRIYLEDSKIVPCIDAVVICVTFLRIVSRSCD